MIKLNIGCGNQLLLDYTNIDLNKEISPKADVYCDIRKGLNYADNTVDEIKAIAVLEHFNKYDHIKIFKDFVRILKVGGVLEIKVPDVTKTLQSLLIDVETKIEFLYGDPKFDNLNLGDAGVHKWGFTKDTLKKLFEENNMQIIHTFYSNIDDVNVTMIGAKIR